MALLKYIGTTQKTILLDGQKKLLEYGQVISGPIHLAKFNDFQIIGKSKSEANVDLSKPEFDGLKLPVVEKDKFVPNVNYAFLDESAKPKVSICIPTKDNYEVINKCLESLYLHTKYDNFEVLICDTGTTDVNVTKLYVQYRDKYGDKFQVFLNQTYNFSKNNNFLAKHAKGDVLLLMNNDIYLTYDAISTMVKYINCSNVGCVGHRLVWEAEPTKIQHDGQIIYDPAGNWVGPGHMNYKADISKISSENGIVPGVTAAFLMIRKNIYEAVGGMDENYKDIYQDVDFNLKVSKRGYVNFCVRERTLVHVDHSSRKGDATEHSAGDFNYYKKTWVIPGKYPVETVPKYSLLICATSPNQLKTLVESIKTTDNYELVFANNRSNYMSSAQALNVLREVSRGEIIFYIHQDVTFDEPEPFTKVDAIIGRLGGFGVIGPAGVQYNGGHYIKGVDYSSQQYSFDAMKVQTLDEFCLITKRSNKLKFGEYLDHYHFYGADICCEAAERGLRNCVVNIPMTHHSGGDGNLKSGDGYIRYKEQARKFYQKWGKKHENIATTTARFQKGQAYYYLAHVIGLTDFEETIPMN